MLRRVSCLLGVVLAFSSFASAQDVDDEKVYFSTWPETEYEVVHPSLPDPAEPVRLSLTRLVTCFLDRGTSPDALVLKERDSINFAFMLTNPGQFNHCWPLGEVRDAVVLRGAGDDGRDAVLSLNSETGLDLHYIEVSEQGSETLVTENVRDSDAWKGALRLWAVEESGASQDVFAVASDGYTLQRISFGTSFSDETSLTGPFGVTRVLSIDYDGTGSRELLLWSDPYLFVLTWSGSLIGYVNAAPNPNDLNIPTGAKRFVTVLPGKASPGSAAERDLVALYLWSYASQRFYIVTFNDGVNSNWFEVGSDALDNRCWDATVGDHDGDGFAELFVCSGSRNTAQMFKRTWTQTPLERPEDSSITFASGGSLPHTGLRALAAGDVDLDGDQDLLGVPALSVLQHTRAGVHTFLSGRLQGHRPYVDSIGGIQELGSEGGVHFYGVHVAWEPPGSEILSAMEPEPSHVLIQAWVERDTGEFGTTDILRMAKVERVIDGADETTLVLESDEQFDLENCAVHVHVGLITKSGSDTYFHASQLLYVWEGESARDKLQYRVGFESGLTIPMGPCGDGCTIGNQGGNTSPGPGPVPRH